MRTFDRIPDLRQALSAARAEQKSIGFVPTMGALHAGHLSLIARARVENDLVVVSVFVNPTQFNDPQDFNKYPRNFQEDSATAQAAGADIVFWPSREEIYPEGFQTLIDVQYLSERLEGASRPGHFQGVATVVAKLLNIVQPARAYFGEKDYQQLQVIRRLVADLDIPTQVVACATVREPDGLAMSSRNVRLTPKERKAATVLSRALVRVAEKARAGERDVSRLQEELAATIRAEPLADLDYAIVVDRDTLRETDIIDHAIALVAARFGAVRLIDNQLLCS